MVLFKMNNHEHRTNQAYESYTFQPLMSFWSYRVFSLTGQHLCKYIVTKESVCIRKEFTSHRTGLGHQHGHCFIVLGHQYGRRDVMGKHSIIRQYRLKMKSSRINKLDFDFMYWQIVSLVCSLRNRVTYGLLLISFLLRYFTSDYDPSKRKSKASSNSPL